MLCHIVYNGNNFDSTLAASLLSGWLRNQNSKIDKASEQHNILLINVKSDEYISGKLKSSLNTFINNGKIQQLYMCGCCLSVGDIYSIYRKCKGKFDLFENNAYNIATLKRYGVNDPANIVFDSSRCISGQVYDHIINIDNTQKNELIDMISGIICGTLSNEELETSEPIYQTFVRLFTENSNFSENKKLIMKGDIDGDYQIGSGDISGILEAVLNDVPSSAIPAIDADEDGHVGSGDVSATLELILSGTSSIDKLYSKYNNEDILLGDLNEDGKITSDDLSNLALIIEYQDEIFNSTNTEDILEWNETFEQSKITTDRKKLFVVCDTNKDGKIDDTDYDVLLDVIKDESHFVYIDVDDTAKTSIISKITDNILNNSKEELYYDGLVDEVVEDQKTDFNQILSEQGYTINDLLILNSSAICPVSLRKEISRKYDKVLKYWKTGFNEGYVEVWFEEKQINPSILTINTTSSSIQYGCVLDEKSGEYLPIKYDNGTYYVGTTGTSKPNYTKVKEFMYTKVYKIDAYNTQESNRFSCVNYLTNKFGTGIGNKNYGKSFITTDQMISVMKINKIS